VFGELMLAPGTREETALVLKAFQLDTICTAQPGFDEIHAG
jgi:hypothetical protein